jgi:uncharacterized membrane protein YphA (DoxX/SURF4 family)
LCQIRAEFSRFSLQAASMHSQNHCFKALPANVVAFPCAHRCTAATASEIVRPSSRSSKRLVAASGAEINARLLVLLGICTTNAAVVLSAVHLLHGS